MRSRLPVVLTAIFVSACGASVRDSPSPPHRGPIVLIAFSGLRADAVGGLGGPRRLTPNLDALIREADLSAAAVAPSSATAPAMASLFTGLSVWQHHGWSPERPCLGEALRTLPEALREVGYETFGYCQLERFRAPSGFPQGFTKYLYVGRLRAAYERLSSLSGERQFVWIYLRQPRPPYLRRERFLSRLMNPPPNLPEKIRYRDLLPFFDPEVSPSQEQKRIFLAMYRLGVAHADELLGRLLGTLRRSGQWDRALVAVTSDHGTELGEHDQIAWGGNLGRKLLEVPLVIKLPRQHTPHLAPQADSRVGTCRLWATLVQAAGGEAPPGVAASLFEAGPRGVLSELYCGNGRNLFSWVEDDLQLQAFTPFAPAQERYFSARLALWGLPTSPSLRRTPEALFADLQEAFQRGRPFDSPAIGSLWRWTPGGSALPVSDRPSERRLMRHLEENWKEYLDEELTPSRELFQEVF